MTLQMICTSTERKRGAISKGWGVVFVLCLSTSSSSVGNASPDNGLMFNGKKYHPFAVEVLTDLLDLAFLDSLVGQERRKQEIREGRRSLVDRVLLLSPFL